MERLNDIINRTAQRRQQGNNTQEPQRPRVPQGQREQRANAGQRPEQQLTRRPLPEQTARLGQRRGQGQHLPSSSTSSMPPTRKYYQHTPRNHALPEPEYTQRPRYPQREVRESYPAHEMNPSQVTRQLYSYEYEQQRERERTPRRSDFGAGSIPDTDASGATGYYRAVPRNIQPASQDNNYYDAYPAIPQADVQEDWEDDAVAMRYGDWEDDSDSPLYQPQRSGRGSASDIDSMGVVPTTSYPRYSDHREYREQPRATREMAGANRSEREIESHPPTVAYPSVTRNGQETPALPAPSSLSPASPAQTEMRPHRHTQPLNPQTVMNMTRELSQEQKRTSQPAHLPNVQPVASASTIVPARSVCPICKGAGFLRADVPVGDPNFGKPVACACKEAERREKRRQQLLELSDLSAFQQSSFTNFNVRSPGITASVKEAYKYARAFADNPHGWFVMIGPNGCGKTHLAAAIANQNLKAGAVVLFTVVPDLLAHLRSTFGPNATEAYDQRFAKMREAELLVLDDLGAHQSSPWASEKLFQLLNYRYNSSFPTVITANPIGLNGLDARILSRMTDAALVTTINLNGAIDYRPHNPRRE